MRKSAAVRFARGGKGQGGGKSARDLGSEARTWFAGQKHPLPAACRDCEWRALCKGGCPRNRRAMEDGSQAPDYFCQSYKQFFSHADSRLRALRERMLSRARYRHEIERIDASSGGRPGRNDPCPCRSGRKHKACCGDPVLSQSYVFRQIP